MSKNHSYNPPCTSYEGREALLQAVHNCRADVLGTIEQAMVGSPAWNLVRNKILRAFGSSKGLEHTIDQIINGSIDENQKQLELFREETSP